MDDTSDSTCRAERLSLGKKRYAETTLTSLASAAATNRRHGDRQSVVRSFPSVWVASLQHPCVLQRDSAHRFVPREPSFFFESNVRPCVHHPAMAIIILASATRFNSSRQFKLRSVQAKVKHRVSVDRDDAVEYTRIIGACVNRYETERAFFVVGKQRTFAFIDFCVSVMIRQA